MVPVTLLFGLTARRHRENNEDASLLNESVSTGALIQSFFLLVVQKLK